MTIEQREAADRMIAMLNAAAEATLRRTAQQDALDIAADLEAQGRRGQMHAVNGKADHER